jgi:hypothetical protein
MKSIQVFSCLVLSLISVFQLTACSATRESSVLTENKREAPAYTPGAAVPLPKRFGTVRLNGKTLRDDMGDFSALGATLFSGPRWYKVDREKLERNLKYLAENGYDYIRVLGEVDWPNGKAIDPRWSDFRDVIAGMTDLAYDKYGIRVQWTIFGSTTFTPSSGDRRRLVDTFLEMSRGREQKIIMFEIANEYWQNGFGGDAGHNELRELSKHMKDNTDILVAASAPTDEEDQKKLYEGGIADVMTLHLDRYVATIDGYWRPVRQPWNEPSGIDMVGSNNEPIGPGSSVNSDRDPMRLVMAAVTSHVSQLPMYVFHSRAGVGLDHGSCAGLGTCDLNGDKDISEMPGSNAYAAMKRYMPAGIENWTRENHYWPGHPFRVYGDGVLNNMTEGGAQNGAMRAFAAHRGDEFIVALLYIKGTMRMEAKQQMSFCAIHPVTGELLQRRTLNAGEAFEFSGLPGLVLKGRHNSDQDGCGDYTGGFDIDGGKSITKGEGPDAFGSGVKTREVTAAGDWRWSEYYYGIRRIKDILWQKDSTGADHNYVVGSTEGSAAEYKMEIGGDYRYLDVIAKADKPAPVYLRIYIDGHPRGTAAIDNGNNANQTVTVDLGEFPFGVHYVAVEFINDFWDGTRGNPDGDRNMYLDGLHASETGRAPLDVNKSITKGLGPDELGSGYKINYAIPAGVLVLSEFYFGGRDIGDIRWENDSNNESHNYVVAYTSGAVAEYKMELGGEFKTLALTGKADQPGPVNFRVYVNGVSVGVVSLNANNNANQTVTLDLGNRPFGVYFVAVEFINDAWDGTGNEDGDRNMFLDTVRVYR